MANYQISIKNQTEANAWLENVKEINQAYNVAMQGAANSLTDMKNMSEGTVVDEFVSLGDGLLNAGQAVFQGIDEIADTVGDVIQEVGKFVDEAKDTIKNVFNNMFGR